MKRSSLLATLAVGLGLAGPAGAEQDSVRVGFVYVGPVGDYGWSFQHDQARQAVEAEYGDRVETTYVESAPEGADAVRLLRQMALSGHDLIFVTSPGYGEAVLSVARQFPAVRFEHATGTERLENLATYSGRAYEGRYVLGLIAGRMTQSDVIGYVGAYPIPEEIRGIDAAFLAARSVNPDVDFRIAWTQARFAPAREAEAAQALIDAGADVLMQHTESTAPIAVAEERGVFAFGQGSEMRAAGPNAQLSALVDNWAPYYVERVGALLDGTWESRATWGGIASGMVEVGAFGDAVPEAVQAEARAAVEAIAAGELQPFTGPINRQDGTRWLAEGETASEEVLLGMDFYVEGIREAIPE
jgi:basic membrane protein A and related proteins